MQYYTTSYFSKIYIYIFPTAVIYMSQFLIPLTNNLGFSIKFAGTGIHPMTNKNDNYFKIMVSSFSHQVSNIYGIGSTFTPNPVSSCTYFIDPQKG